jgi:hypothetical protein
MQALRHGRSFPALLLALAGLTCGGERGPAPPGDAELARGAEILRPFKQGLLQALDEGLAGGPEEAIGVCRVQAPRVAAALSRDGVRVGRTSHRLRNPANAPPGWAEPLLAAQVADAAQRGPRAVALPAGRVGYVEPIFVQPRCLACHGETLPAPVAAALAALYPEDRARGFREGDFRGLFWVEFPAGPGAG